MTYELRVIPDCPNSTAALDLFRRALAAESTAADVRVVDLSSEEQARSLNFHVHPPSPPEAGTCFLQPLPLP